MAEQSTFARRMMAQKLMTEKRDDPFSDSPFFQGFGDALLGQDNIQDRGTILPVGRSPEGDIVPAFPEFITGAARGVRDAATTVGRAMQGDPRYIPVDGKLPDDVVDEITNFGLTFGGAGMTGANLLRGSIPEGAIGIFAGQRASSFPGAKVANEKGQEILKEQNRLMGEYKYVTNELTKGRMQLGDDVANDLTARKTALQDQMQANTSQLGKLEDQALGELEKRFASTDEKSFFRDTDREFGKGLFKLPDNQFRFEIDDRPAAIKIDIDDDADALFSNITSDALERVLPNTERGASKKLGDFLDHDELFENYPQLKNYETIITFDPKSDSRGSFSPSRKTITVNLADMRPLGDGAVSGASLKRQIKSTLVHEIQHAVQEIEGFARGYNTQASGTQPVIQAIRNNKDILDSTRRGEIEYGTARAELQVLSDAERIKYYEEMATRDSFQPRRLFNQANWYKYGDDIRRELQAELGYSYDKRKSVDRERWIAAAFGKLAKYERAESMGGAALADRLAMKEIKSQYGKQKRIADKNYDDFARSRNARFALDKFRDDPRYNIENPNLQYNVYLDSLGEAEARAVQARAEPFGTAQSYGRMYFPPGQFEENFMENAPPFGLQNTLRQQGGFFIDPSRLTQVTDDLGILRAPRAARVALSPEITRAISRNTDRNAKKVARDLRQEGLLDVDDRGQSEAFYAEFERIKSLKGERKAVKPDRIDDLERNKNVRSLKADRLKAQKPITQSPMFEAWTKPNRERVLNSTYDSDTIDAEARLATVEAIAREAKKRGLEVYYTSKGQRGRAGSRYIELPDGGKVRVSDHELPDTAGRQYTRSQGIGNFADEIIVSDWETSSVDDYLKRILGEE
jgi:hypothetical protein